MNKWIKSRVKKFIPHIGTIGNTPVLVDKKLADALLKQFPGIVEEVTIPEPEFEKDEIKNRFEKNEIKNKKENSNIKNIKKNNNH